MNAKRIFSGGSVSHLILGYLEEPTRHCRYCQVASALTIPLARWLTLKSCANIGLEACSTQAWFLSIRPVAGLEFKVSWELQPTLSFHYREWLH